MVVCYSFLNQSICNLTFFGTILKSVGLNYFVFNADTIFHNQHIILYDSPKIIILGLFLFGFISLLVYQFLKIKTTIGYFIDKNKETDISKKEYHLYFLFFGIAIIVILQRVTKVSIKGLLKEISDGSYDLTP